MLLMIISEIGDGDNEDTLLDKGKSGDFLIRAVRHSFAETNHNVSMSIVKLMKEL